MDAKARKLEKKLNAAREREEDEDPIVSERKALQKKLLGQLQHEKDTARHMIKKGVKEFHSRPIEGLKSTEESFDVVTLGMEDQLAKKMYGLVTLEDLKQKKLEVEIETAEAQRLALEKRKIDEEEAKRVKEESRAKRIKAQKSALSFQDDEEEEQ